MEVLKGQQDFGQVIACHFLFESSFLLQTSAHIATRCIVEQQEQLFRRLESILKTNDEWMLGICKHVALRFRVLDEVLTQDLLLIQNLHRVILSCFNWLRAILIEP